MESIEAHVPKTAKQRGRIAPAKLAHIVRRTNRFDEMVDWYSKVLEAEVVFANEMLAFLTYDEEHHRIAIATVPGLEDRPENTVGTDHVAFTYGSLADLVHTYTRLRGLGIEPFWAINHGPTTSMYYKDPDANRIELQIDNFPDVAGLNDWMKGGAFEENPIGVNFDPDDLCARFEAGEPAERLLERPPLPDGMTPFDMLRF